jgi:hypothetical protein
MEWLMQTRVSSAMKEVVISDNRPAVLAIDVALGRDRHASRHIRAFRELQKG